MSESDFNDLFENYSAAEIKSVLDEISTDELVKALMGACPAVNNFFEQAFPEINFKAERERIGSVRIEEVENAQNKIMSLFKFKTEK